MKDTLSKRRAVQAEVEVLFHKVPESQPLLRQTKYTSWDRQTFESDNWIFQGTLNSSDAIMEDLFDSMDVKLPDNKYSQQICARLSKAHPLHFGEIGGESLDNKFSGTKNSVVRYDKENKPHTVRQTGGQLTRQIFEDCSFSNGSVRVPQQTQPGAVSIPSQYRIENISKYANITLKQASVMSRIYCELGLQFKDVIKINKAIRNRRVKNPWDIKINKDGLTLLKCAEELKKVRRELNVAPDWMYYDDGIFQFEILDNLAAHSIEELDLSDEVDPLASKPGEYTYWNTSTIKTSDTARGRKTYKQFIKAIRSIWNKTVSKKKLPALQKYAKKFTPSQRRELSQAIQQQYA